MKTSLLYSFFLKGLGAFFLAALACCSASAQQKIENPTGAQVLRQHLSKDTSWEIKVSDAGNAKEPPDPTVGSFRLTRTTLERNGTVMRVVRFYGSEREQQFWLLSNHQLMYDTLRKQVFQIDPTFSTYLNFTKTDFPELEWIESLPAARKEEKEGQPYWVFESNGKTALIAAEGGLPHQIIYPTEVHSYSYGPPPPPLQPPALIQSELERWIKKTKAALPVTPRF